ncbi:MAG: membrane protein insertase YidC [Elusimicrobiaceae bacterium]
MNRNLILAFALSFLVYIGWFMWAEKNKPVPAKVAAEATSAANPAVNEIPEAAATKSLSPMPSAQTAKLDLSPIPFTCGKAEIELNRMGAAISSFKYNGPVNQAELVLKPEPGFFATMPGVYFNLAKQEGNIFRFEAELSKGVGIKKTYAFGENGLGSIEVTVKNSLASAVEIPEWGFNFGPGIGTVESEVKENPKEWKTVYAYKKEGNKHATVERIKKTDDTPKGPWLWAGIENRYFLAALIPDKWPFRDLKFSEEKTAKEERPSLLAYANPTVINGGEEKTWTFSFYFGPKDYRTLQALGHELDRSVEFGFFSVLGKLAMKVLYFNYGFTKNYGWSIVLLTLLVQLILLPFTIKSAKSMMLMKKIQPEMQHLQQKYKKDPQRLNQEMFDLYKRHKVNPLGGCIPMLFQIPVFFALFTALRNSWSLHGAPWIFWIHDLSSKDPYYILPILNGALMFLQQKLTMSSDENNPQMAVLKWMPLIFTFMFLTFPSGLVVYWIISSVINIAQQYWMKKTLKA